ncbi:MAG: HipA domain-containing protein [Deltaproteobacteria bacterium]|nr:HipA domain-containing protein [Deltaproteobacteria bacterium]
MTQHICLACEQSLEIAAPSPYHRHCLKKIFGTTKTLSLKFSTEEIYYQAQKMVGQMSISGVQEKLSVYPNKKDGSIDVAAVGGSHILKPSPSRFPHLAENENFFMNLATALSIETPAHGLFALSDGPLSYVVKRFDRDDVGGKIPVEDFVQLLGGRDKYAGSIEQIGRFLMRHSSIPFIDTQKLFVRTLFNFVIGNGDAHMKNFSMILLPDQGYRLAPAYDIVSSRLVIPNEKDDLALSLNGKRNNITTNDFLKLAEYLEIEKKRYEQIMGTLRDLKNIFEEKIFHSPLPPQMKEQAKRIFLKRFHVLLAKAE